MTLGHVLASGVHSTDQLVVLAANQFTGIKIGTGRMAKTVVVYDGSAVCVHSRSG